MVSYLLEAFHRLSEAFPYLGELGRAEDEGCDSGNDSELGNAQAEQCSGSAHMTAVMAILTPSAPIKPCENARIRREAQRRSYTCGAMFHDPSEREREERKRGSKERKMDHTIAEEGN